MLNGDARILLRHMVAPASLHAVRVFFPDPCPKARDAKRRLVTPAFADMVADRLVDNGVLHVATDMAEYAEAARTVLVAHPGQHVLAAAPWRPTV